MPESCVYLVGNFWTACDFEYFLCAGFGFFVHAGWVKPGLFRKWLHTFSEYFSTAVCGFLPLYPNIFSPLSTIPITTTTKLTN